MLCSVPSCPFAHNMWSTVFPHSSFAEKRACTPNRDTKVLTSSSSPYRHASRMSSSSSAVGWTCSETDILLICWPCSERDGFPSLRFIWRSNQENEAWSWSFVNTSIVLAEQTAWANCVRKLQSSSESHWNQSRDNKAFDSKISEFDCASNALWFSSTRIRTQLGRLAFLLFLPLLIRRMQLSYRMDASSSAHRNGKE